MAQPQKLGDVIKELMAIFKQRGELEQRAGEGRATAGDCAELGALNRRLQK